MLGRQLACARPADLAANREVSDHLAVQGQAPEPAGLLLACLEHRFEADVAIGDTRPMTADSDDIAL